MSANKRNRFSLQLKYKIAQLIDKNVPNKDIIDKFSCEGITLNNIYDIKRNRNQIVSEFEGSLSAEVKSVRKSVYPEVEKELIAFMSSSAVNEVPINTMMIKDKALQIAQNMGITGFKASNGWIGRLKTRNNIKFATIHGEASSVPEETCIDWTQIKLPELIKDYEPQDVFNADEFGLFWRLAPTKHT